MWGKLDARTDHRSGWLVLFALCLAVVLVSGQTRAQQAPLPGAPEGPSADGSLELGEIEDRTTAVRERLGEWKRKSREYQQACGDEDEGGEFGNRPSWAVWRAC